MENDHKFRVQAGELYWEIEGSEAFVQKQIDAHQELIGRILAEQARLIESGEVANYIRTGRRGRPARRGRRGAGQRPGRQPVIIRDSDLVLKPRQQQQLLKSLAKLAGGGLLGKDATVFAIAWYLCNEVLKKDVFTAGDIIAVYNQLPREEFLPEPVTVDVVQMLRNLAAVSIGKEWVARNSDGTFSLTARGREVGTSGAIVRPRGRRPSASRVAATGAEAEAPRRRGRPPQVAGGENAEAAEARPRKRAPRE